MFTLDTTTGHVIAQVSTRFFTGISFNPGTGVLYGVANGALNTDGLFTIDIPTGAATLIGSLSLVNPLDIQFVSVPEPSSALLATLAVLDLVALSWRRCSIRTAISMPPGQLPSLEGKSVVFRASVRNVDAL